MSQRHFGGKTWWSPSFFYEFSANVGGENKISNVRSFIILGSGERVTSFTKDNNANFSRENGKMKLSGKSTFWEDAKKTSSEISYS